MARRRKSPSEEQQRAATLVARPQPPASNADVRGISVPSPADSRADTFISLALIILVAAIAYSNTFSVAFTFDDRPGIVFNEDIRDLRAFGRIISSAVAGEPRPLVNLSFAFNYAVGKLDPVGYHLVNLLLHIGTGVLVYRIVPLLVKLFAPAMQARAAAFPTLGLLTALLFVSHPVQTEAVTYVWGRSDVLSTFFYLLSLLCFLRAYHVQEPRPQQNDSQQIFLPRTGRERRYYWRAVAAFALALSTKSTVLTLPFLLLILDMYLLRPQTGARQWWHFLRRSLPFALLAGVRVYLYYILPQQSEVGYAFRHREVWNERLDLFANILTQCRALVDYLFLLVVPTELNVDHDLPAVRSLFDFSAVASLGVCGMLIVIGAFWSRRFPLAAFLLWWFLGSFLFFFLFPLPDFLVERRLYLPSVAFCTGLAIAMQLLGHRLARRWPALDIAVSGTRWALVGLVLVYTVVTIQRNEIWRDPHTLWSDTVIKSPGKARPYSNLAIVNLEQKKYEEAIVAAQKALTINPAIAEAHYTLLDSYMGQGAWPQAQGQFSRTLRAHPYYAVEWYSWTHAKLSVQENPFLAAFSAFDQELMAQPGNADGHIALGFLYASLLQDEPRALRHLEEGLKGNSTRFRRRVVVRAAQDLRQKLSGR